MTVAEIDALLYLPGHDQERWRGRCEITALSPGWQGSFTSMLAGGPDVTGNAGLTDARRRRPSPGRAFGRSGWSASTGRATRSCPFDSRHADGMPLPAAVPGQFVALRLTVSDDRPIATRSYSLSGPAGGRSTGSA